MTTVSLSPMTTDEASAILLRHIREAASPSARGRRAPGWDIDLGDVINAHIGASRRSEMTQPGAYTYDPVPNSAPFHEAAWALVSRGILRPSTTFDGRTAPTVSGIHFGLTAYARKWLDQAPTVVVLPSEYGRFGQLLAGHAVRFGPGYHVRSQEAVGCYQAHTYLACCAMCGAAAEAITLALAIAKTGDEERVRKDYESAGGRGRMEKLLMAQQNALVMRELPNYLDLLKYWRDSAAHGLASPIQEAEAFTSLLLLLRFAQFASDRWADLTT
jgi:hypothetical protein